MTSFLRSVRIRQRTLKNIKNKLNVTAKHSTLVIRPGQIARPMLIRCAWEHKKLLRTPNFFQSAYFTLQKKEKTIRSTNFQSNSKTIKNLQYISNSIGSTSVSDDVKTNLSTYGLRIIQLIACV